MKLNNFIVCDTVRQERTNKHILVGVYSDSIIVVPADTNLAVSLPLAFFIRFLKDDEKEAVPEDFIFTASFDQNEGSKVVCKGRLKSNNDIKYVDLVISVQNFSIPRTSGIILFEISLTTSEGDVVKYNLGKMKFVCMNSMPA